MSHTCSFPPPHSLCSWSLKNVVASRYRVSNVVTEKNFGLINIDWDSNPVQVKFELIGEEGILSSFPLSLSDLELSRNPSFCPTPIEQPNWYWKRVFWCSVVLSAVLTALLFLRILFIVGRWVTFELLKDLDMNIKRRIKKLRLVIGNYSYKKKNKVHSD